MLHSLTPSVSPKQTLCWLHQQLFECGNIVFPCNLLVDWHTMQKAAMICIARHTCTVQIQRMVHKSLSFTASDKVDKVNHHRHPGRLNGQKWSRCMRLHTQTNVIQKSIVFEENKYCGAKEGPKSAIFGTIDLEPLYFHVNIVILHICHNHHNRWLCKKNQSGVKFSKDTWKKLI